MNKNKQIRGKRNPCFLSDAKNDNKYRKIQLGWKQRKELETSFSVSGLEGSWVILNISPCLFSFSKGL